jgi:class I fructose-bisphosphate aldolase
MGQVASKCAEWGMPLLAMVYARGPKVKSEWDPSTVAHCARLAEELGADVIKVVYTGDPESFSRVTEGCCIPIVIAGGPRMDSPRDIIQMAHDSIAAGGAGLSMGRNIFQAEDPTRLVQALHAVVHMDYSVDQALALLEEPKL